MALRPNVGHGFFINDVLDHKQRHTTVGRTPLDEWSVRNRDLYLTTHNTHKRQISMSPTGFERTIFSRRAALDRTITGSVLHIKRIVKYRIMKWVEHVAWKKEMRNSYNNLTAMPEWRIPLRKPMHGEKNIIEIDCVNCVWENLDLIRFTPDLLSLVDFVLFTIGRLIFRSAEQLQWRGIALLFRVA